jgi:plastocyanin
MKKLILSILIIASTTLVYGKIWTVVNSGFAFSPATLTITVGDSVQFTLASIHNAVEVSQTSWNANDPTALPGGFNVPLSGGLVPASQLVLGTHWYVCTVHVASMGMKGTITVQNATSIMPDLHIEHNISIYPNPVTSMINLNLNLPKPQKAQLMILNITGQEIMERQIENGENIIDISDLLNGVYYFIITTNEKKIFTSKTIIINQ